MFLASAWFGEVAVVVLYIRIGGAVAELSSDGWPACGRAGRLFFDDTLVFVTIVMFCHLLGWMTCQGMLLYSLESVIACMRLALG
jgi:hypothetical protein